MVKSSWLLNGLAKKSEFEAFENFGLRNFETQLFVTIVTTSVAVLLPFSVGLEILPITIINNTN